MILLASASAVRARLLRDAGLAFDVVVSGLDEAPIKAESLARGEAPRVIALRLAEAKALAAPTPSDAWVIGADQTLDIDGQLLDKPADRREARAHLERLRGRDHHLHCAAVLVRDGAIIWRCVTSPRLRMRAFSDAFLADYVERCGEAKLTSVGGYVLEGPGAQLFDEVDGDYFSILGLPLIELLGALRDAGAISA